MTIAEKQNIADFLDTTENFLFTGYMGQKRTYNFNDDPIQPQTAGTAKNAERTSTADSLEKIACEIRRCQNCRLAQTRKNTVPGEGVENPVVMVIGEGPGADEDAQGRPFVGRAGRLLDKMLDAINLSRNTNCFIANIVKCRPPSNRDPHPEERAACSYFLQQQIKVLKPKFILVVGVIAVQSLLKITEPIGKIHGKFFDYQIGDLTIPVMATYHPSALLRYDDYKRPAWEDLKLLQKRMAEKNYE